MILKKIALIGSTLTVLALPVLANADLVTCNYTSGALAAPSTVKIMSSPLPVKPCSSAYPNGVTNPGTCLPPKPAMIIKTICGAKTGTCIADVYPSANCDASGAKPIAHITIDLGTITVTSATMINTAYAIDGVPGSKITVRNAR